MVKIERVYLNVAQSSENRDTKSDNDISSTEKILLIENNVNFN